MKANATNTLHTIATAAHPRLAPSLPTPKSNVADMCRPTRGNVLPRPPHPPTAPATRRHTGTGAAACRRKHRCRPHLRPVLLSSHHARLQSNPLGGSSPKASTTSARQSIRSTSPRTTTRSTNAFSARRTTGACRRSRLHAEQPIRQEVLPAPAPWHRPAYAFLFRRAGPQAR